ncbi:MAG: hypothetical protein ACLTX3_06865 [Lachnospiraceae bacterium]
MIYGYDYDGNLLCADISSGKILGKITITEKAKKIMNKTGDIVSMSYFDYQGFGFNSLQEIGSVSLQQQIPQKTTWRKIRDNLMYRK